MSREKLRSQIGQMLEEMPEDAHPVDAGTITGSIQLDEQGLSEQEVRQIVVEEAARREIPVGKT